MIEPLVPIEDFPAGAGAMSDGQRVRYLDAAATSLRPQVVIDAVANVDRSMLGNVNRAGHRYAEEITAAYEGAREPIASWLGADPSSIVFTAGASDAIRRVAYGLRLQKEDLVAVPAAEHHSNLVPWISNATIDPVRVDACGLIDLDALDAQLARQRPRLLAFAWVSHVTGAVQPARAIVEIAHRRGTRVLVDAAQAAGHGHIDVDASGADFVVLSGHKMLGPTGIGVLTGRRDSLEDLDPSRGGGGGAVDGVTLESVTFRTLPWRLEPGTPPIAQAIGLAAAATYLTTLGAGRMREHGSLLARRLAASLASIEGVELFAPQAPFATPIATFRVAGLAPVGLAQALDHRAGLLTRSGTLCAQPAFAARGWADGGVRVSLGAWSSTADIEALTQAVSTIARSFA